MSCYGGLKCNIQDLVEEEAKKKEEEANAPVNLNSIPSNDERRNMFCGFNWADASKKCSVWSVYNCYLFLFAITFSILLVGIHSDLFLLLVTYDHLIMQKYANNNHATICERQN